MAPATDRRGRPVDTSPIALLAGDEFIMDPEVGRVLEEYVSSGGETVVAIDALASGYKGTAQICNTICGWLSDLGAGDEAVECVEKSVANQLIRHFHPDTADGIFSEDGGVGVDWMPKLVSHRRWRKVMYELVEHFPQSLMLNFAVRLISDAGFQNEISNVNTATQQLEIFSRVMLAEVKVVADLLTNKPSYLEVDNAMEELVRVVTQTEQSYLYAMALLENIARNEKGKVAATALLLVEGIRSRMAGKEHEVTSIRCAMLQTTEDRRSHAHSNQDSEVRNSRGKAFSISGEVAASMTAMIAKGMLNPTDVAYIHEAFSSPNPPPVMLIRDYSFVRLLYDSLFAYDKPRVSDDHRDRYVYLLAYACSAKEKVNSKKIRTVSRLELEPERDAIEKAVSCTDGPLEEVGMELRELIFLTRHASVAMGLLHFVRSVLMSEGRIGEPPPFIYVLLDHVSTQQKKLHNAAFEVVVEVYEKVSRETEVAEIVMMRQRTIIDRFVHLFSVGAILPVLQKMTVMFNEASIDASLVRYFVLEVLELIAPPYSVEISKMLLPLVEDTEIIDEIVREKTPIVKTFMKEAKSLIEGAGK